MWLTHVGLPAQTMDKLTDARDGKVYKTVTFVVRHSKDSIDSMTWMAENLNFDNAGSSCFNNEATNCEAYGRLYTFQSAMEGCPAGWQVPTNNQWLQLVNHFGGLSKAGKMLKSKSDLWTGSRPELEGMYLGDKRYKGNNKSRFSILPVGTGTPTSGYFKFGLSTVFWSSKSKTEAMAWDWIFSASSATVINSDGDKTTTGNAVRCIKIQ